MRKTRLLLILELVGQPVEAFIEAVTTSRTCCLNVPVAVSQRVKSELVSNLRRIHSIWQILYNDRHLIKKISSKFKSLWVDVFLFAICYLFVGKYKQDSVAKFVFLEHTMQFVTCLPHTFTIIAVNDEDETLCILEIVAPQRSNLVLTADVPHSEADVLVLDGFNVESWRKYNLENLDDILKLFFKDLNRLPIVGMVVTISPSFSL